MTSLTNFKYVQGILTLSKWLQVLNAVVFQVYQEEEENFENFFKNGSP